MSENAEHPSLKAIAKYRKYSGIIAIASKFTKECFCFSMNTREDALKEISMLDSLKSIQATEIPVKAVKRNINFFVEQICTYINESIGKEKFSNCLKLANITPAFKNGARTSENNCKPVSILPVYSKIFEKLLQN